MTDESSDQEEDTPQYGGRRRRVSEAFAAHVRTGCGLGAKQAPLVRAAGETLWFHFGGEVFELALCELFPALFGRTVIARMVLSVLPGFDATGLGAVSAVALERFVRNEGLRLLEDEGIHDLGRHTRGAASISDRKWPMLKSLLASG